MCAYEAKKCVCMSKYAHTYLCHECPCFWTKHYENCTVHFYVMTLILKFHKDLSFCCGDMPKITLSMHARGINANFWYTFLRRVRAYVYGSLPKFIGLSTTLLWAYVLSFIKIGSSIEEIFAKLSVAVFFPLLYGARQSWI